MNKSMSLDNFDAEFASTVSASSSLSDLEATALHHNVTRAVLSPRNASPNFAINPIFENSDKIEEVSFAKVRDKDVNDGSGFVENKDIVRLKIPNKPKITEELFESYTNVRRSNTLRNEDICVRAKRSHASNYPFGGSLRLSKGFHSDLW